MSKKEASIPRREYTDEFKQEAVRLAESIGGHPAAKRLGIPQSTLTTGRGAAALECSGLPHPQGRPNARCRSSRRRTAG